MSEADLEVIRDHFVATNERDFERAMGHYADDVVLEVREGFLNTGTFEGKEAVGEWFGDWFRMFGADYHFEIDEIRDLGNGGIFLSITHGGSGRSSGAEVQAENGYLYRVEEGRIRRLQLFPTRDEALKAAALPEWSAGQTD